jgi:hypothetical protein
MPTIYELIRDLRREHPTPSASRTLDMVVAELGQTNDNLQRALKRLEGRAVPIGGKRVLEELAERARAAGVDDIERPVNRRLLVYEPVDESQAGIAFLLGLSAVVAVLLVAIAIVGVFHGA